MSDTIHHTIRNLPSAQLLLARQWAERINYEFETLTECQLAERAVWRDRLGEELKTAVERIHEDGFEYLLHISTYADVSTIVPLELRFVPYINDLFWGGGVVDKLAVYSKAVQS